MKLVWNPKEACFEAVFQDFQNDLNAVKAAGFKTTGPPEWKWFTLKISPLDKLKKNRPASGLTILEDALVEYNRIKEEDAGKAALLAELKAAKKANKRAKKDDLSGYAMCPEGFMCVCVEPVKLGSDRNRFNYVPPEWTGSHCFICKDTVYPYERQEPATCIYCEIVVDNGPELW